MRAGMARSRPVAEQPCGEQPVFRHCSKLVRDPVFVTDRSGKTIARLTPGPVQVMHEHEPHRASRFREADRPVSPGRRLDPGGGMRAVRPRTIDVLRNAIESALARARAQGSTAGFDSILPALQYVRHHFAELKRLSHNADTYIYGLAAQESLRHRAAVHARASRELPFGFDHGNHLPKAASRSTPARQSTRVIGFLPTVSSGGNGRQVKDRQNPRAGKSLRVNARSGYFHPGVG